ncbi:MAG: hypothetical protein HC902_11000 [Calothrix sp. SM1_5_4]|nr:hypothetical protein [Calothrix sp. SM1_5_4]
MEISRRRLLQLGLLSAGTTALAGGSMRGHAESDGGFSVIRRSSPSVVQGATDESRTQFSIVHRADDSFDFYVRNSSRESVWIPDKVETHSLPGQGTVVSKAYFSDLRLNETFFFAIERDGVLKDEREFRMLDTKAERIRFAICSCMDDGRHSPEIWQDLVEHKPDFILFVGDCTYCDYGPGDDMGPSRLWRRFSEARATLEIYFSRKLIPIFATWDDHDFGQNDSGREYPWVTESQVNFMRFFAMEPSHCAAIERGPGVSSAFILGRQQFVLMDDRSFRIAGSSRDATRIGDRSRKTG